MQQSIKNSNKGSFSRKIIGMAVCSGIALSGCATAPEPVSRLVPAAAYTATGLGFTEVNGFDVYADNDRIDILVAGLTATNAKKPQLRYLNSTDGGKHWSAPIALPANLPDAALAKAGNEVQLAVHGKQLLALWQTTGELPGMGPLTTAYSTDGGNTWQPGVNPAANPEGDQSHADLAVDKDGVFHAVWLADPEENGYQSLHYSHSTDLGRHWLLPKTLDDSTCSCCWNTLKITPSGELNVLYRDMKPRDMALLQSTDHGNHWRKLGRVGEFNWEFDGCPHIGGGLAYRQTGSGYALDSVVWTGKTDKAGLYHLHSDDFGVNWSAAHPLGKNPLHADIAVTGPNRIIAVWDERQPDGSEIVSAQSLDNGRSWSAPERLSEKTAIASYPRIVATNSGAVVFWLEKQNHRKNQWAYRLLK